MHLEWINGEVWCCLPSFYFLCRTADDATVTLDNVPCSKWLRNYTIKPFFFCCVVFYTFPIRLKCFSYFFCLKDWLKIHWKKQHTWLKIHTISFYFFFLFKLIFWNSGDTRLQSIQKLIFILCPIRNVTSLATSGSDFAETISFVSAVEFSLLVQIPCRLLKHWATCNASFIFSHVHVLRKCT